MKREIIGALLAIMAIMSPAMINSNEDHQIRPCATEDDQGLCLWTQDQSEGRSFLVWPYGDPRENDDDLVLYLD